MKIKNILILTILLSFKNKVNIELINKEVSDYIEKAVQLLNTLH